MVISVVSIVAVLVLSIGGVAVARARSSCDATEDAMWDRYRDLRPLADAHPNALWARHWWIGDEKSSCEYRQLARQIRQLGLTDVFFHAGPLRPDGTVNVDRYRHAKDLVAAMHDLVPGLRVQAYLGQFEGTRPGTDDLDLRDADNRGRVVDSARIFLDLGYDGIHYDIEPLMNDDAPFLELFDRTRELTRARGAVLSTAVEEVQATADSGFDAKPDPSHPTPAWLRTLADHVDQVAIMTYDSGQKTPEDYERWTEYQTRTVGDLIADKVTVFMGVPTDKEFSDAHTAAENAGTGSRGLRRGVAALAPDRVKHIGGAIFAEWVSTEDDYATFEREWVRPAGS